jgi:magnesium-transporting ATPase (P-type)
MGKFLLRWLVVFIVANVLGFVVHELLLKADYAANQQLLRTQQGAQAHFIYMLLGLASMAAAMVWIYGRGIQARPWVGQGLRFGLAMWSVISVPMFLIYFSVQPWPATVVVKQIGYELPMMLLIGLTLGALHKGQSAPAQLSQSASAR